MEAFVEGMEKAQEGITLIWKPHDFIISPACSFSQRYYSFVEHFFIYQEESPTLCH